MSGIPPVGPFHAAWETVSQQTQQDALEVSRQRWAIGKGRYESLRFSFEPLRRIVFSTEFARSVDPVVVNVKAVAIKLLEKADDLCKIFESCESRIKEAKSLEEAIECIDRAEGECNSLKAEIQCLEGEWRAFAHVIESRRADLV